jgi:hypothetical protein
MTGTHDNNGPIVYWHRDLPPLDAELVAEHTVEASSSRVSGTLEHREELWDQCHQELMTNTTNRLVEEVARSADNAYGARRSDQPQGMPTWRARAWMHRGFTYMLYRRGRLPWQESLYSDGNRSA